MQGWPDLSHDLNQAIKVTKSDFFNVLVLFVVHNCRNEAVNITKRYFFYKYFLICIPKFCIDQAIKVTFLIFLMFWSYL